MTTQSQHQTVDEIVDEVRKQAWGESCDIETTYWVDRLAERLKPVIEELEVEKHNITVKKNALFQSLIDAEAKIDQQAAEIRNLRASLKVSEMVFRHYGDLHALKPDMDNAARNYAMADRMKAALAELTPPDGEG